MFNHIATNYDFLNHFLSLGIDRIWRKQVIAQLSEKEMGRMLDVATGTGDLAIAAALKYSNLIIDAVDIAISMLDVAKRKVDKRNLGDRIKLQYGDAENLNFSGNAFDYVTSAFGVRNFENVQKGLNEMYRVTKSGGKIVVLEFSKPHKSFFAFIFRIYFKYILPICGKIVSGNRSAYRYLPESVNSFPERDDFVCLLRNAGFVRCSYTPLTSGIACMYIGEKSTDD